MGATGPSPELDYWLCGGCRRLSNSRLGSELDLGGDCAAILVGWRWLLARWTRPAMAQMESAIAKAQEELAAEVEAETATGPLAAGEAEAALEQILAEAKADPPVWEDWNPFWQRCRDVVSAVAQTYHPEVKYPLLNIYVPDAYGLLRGTVDDVDRWIESLSPVLGQVTIGQAVQGYEFYPQSRTFGSQALAGLGLGTMAAESRRWLRPRTVSQPSNNQATQQLLGNLSTLLREATLRNLYRQSVALYSGTLPLPCRFPTRPSRWYRQPKPRP